MPIRLHKKSRGRDNPPPPTRTRRGVGRPKDSAVGPRGGTTMSMRRVRWIPRGLVVGLGLASVASVTLGQVVERERERDVMITGPRGRTIQRQLKTARTPGSVRREIHIDR